MSLYEKMWNKLKENVSPSFFISSKGDELSFNLWEIKNLIRDIEKQVEIENVCNRCEYSELHSDKYCIKTKVICTKYDDEKIFAGNKYKPFGVCEVVPKETDKPKMVKLDEKL